MISNENVQAASTNEARKLNQLIGLSEKPYSAVRRWFVAALVLQGGVIATICSTHALTLFTGTQVQVHAAPVDPTDPFRGDYLSLNLDISHPEGVQLTPGQTVYAVLRKNTPYWTFERLETSLPETDAFHVALRGVVAERFGKPYIKYGLDRAFIPERTGGAFGSRVGFTADVAVDKFGNSVLRGVRN